MPYSIFQTTLPHFELSFAAFAVRKVYFRYNRASIRDNPCPTPTNLLAAIRFRIPPKGKPA
ncbi:hypothetical protein HMPREF3156_02250 [Neisseria sp. HMSC06F02]|nr:hypothetical protein HMPREF3156_02250 [Neisseria sp. HMSC06F02]